jgi:putative glutamine amidotransferase
VRATEVTRMRNDAVAGGRPYFEALQRAGAEGALLLPREGTDLHGVLERFDGVLLLGGGDVDPGRYGATAAPEVRGVDPAHDDTDLAACRAALDLGLPVLAVCRGLQVLNVALGGTLHQHIEGHVLVERRHELVAGSRTATAVRAMSITGHCVHHQALDRLGAGLVVTARDAVDGVVEGAELAGPSWVVGVQWHPEDRAESDPANQALFDAFAAACRGRSR